MSEWLIYRGTGEPHDGMDRIPAPPPWRKFDGGPLVEPPEGIGTASTRRLGVNAGGARLHRPRAEELELINAALYLRRPLLVTGDPGSGKSTIAHAVAHELGLGRVLYWPVVSRTSLQDGLYRYDAIARLQDVQLARTEPALEAGGESDPAAAIGRYVRLGPLGTALLPNKHPRVLLVDELDKSDIDLPNDLLNVLEEGEFAIPELERIADRVPEVQVLSDDGRRVTVRDGRVRCAAFPFIVLTSNGERDFPAPLLRRCIHLQLPPPDRERLAAMVRAHFGETPGGTRTADEIIEMFLDRPSGEVRAADQLLNAIYLAQIAAPEDLGARTRIAEQLMQPLDRTR
ncbi:AAA family ATPase [Streptomyces mangrovisoli]|uniref:AAA family ATPase n=1 Tax=Streptomyces mangrovisoli TaxID=1428628 RepID=A0A1J4NMF5_9ACTN|nr:MoxR family ATPase [Streptomyces mangrovisoli]OIJ63593.1 AAA family ATPase [Streptomyces mangrovisoli]